MFSSSFKKDSSLKVIGDEKIMEESPESIDDILSKELMQLSLKKRNAIDEEIHGVTKLAPKESPKFLEAALAELSAELNEIPNELPLKAAFLESQIFPSTYVNTANFRLRFLRCDLFDAKKAAMRLIAFLDLAVELFGPQVLRRPMRVTDFTKEEAKLLNTGNVQIMPYRDRAGRPILAWVGDFAMGEVTIAKFKITQYLWYAISEDAECQREGITFLVWAVSSPIKFSVKPDWENSKIQERLFAGLPVRQTSTHFCLPDRPYFHMIRYMTGIAMGKHKTSLRFHVGEEVEVKYQLKTYGIPVELIPVTGTGNVKTLYHKQWLKARKYLEEMMSMGNDTSSIVICPKSTDVVFRAGGRFLTSHPGNAMFHSLIESRMEEHSTAHKHGKIAIIKSIIDSIQQQQGGSGRFLTWDARGGWWTQLMDESDIHSKVASSVKELKKKWMGQKVQVQITRSSTFVFQNQDNKKRRKLTDDGSYSDSSCDCNLNCF